MNALFVSVNHFKLIEFCKEYGFMDGKCNDKRAIAAMSRYGTLLSIFGGVSIISTGFWGAVSNRLGRKLIILIAITGCSVAGATWAVIYGTDWGLSKWKYLYITGWTIMSAAGGLLIVFLGVYGALTDVSSAKPKDRPWLFVIIDAIMAVSGVIGIQLPAFLLAYDLRYLTMIITGILAASWLFALIFVRNTIPEAISSQPIDWSRAHTIGSILFMCPVKHTRRMLEEDAQQVYQHRLEQYNASSTSLDGAWSGNAGETINNTSVSEETTTFGDNADGEVASVIIPEEGIIAAIEQYTPDDLSEVLLPPQDKEQSHHHGNTMDPLDEPKYIKPGNTVYLMGAITGIVFTLMMGHRTVAFMYLKQEFSISAHFYSNLLTAEAVCRAVGTMVLTPLLKPRIRTRSQEVKVIKYSMIAKAFFLGIIPFCTSLPMTFVVCLLSQLSSCLVPGFVRGLISNEVSSQLQGRILGGLASMDVVVLTFGGVLYNMIFNYTSDFFPAFAYLFMSLLAFIGAALPAFISDDSKTFNSRNFGGITFSKDHLKDRLVN